MESEDKQFGGESISEHAEGINNAEAILADESKSLKKHEQRQEKSARNRLHTLIRQRAEELMDGRVDYRSHYEAAQEFLPSFKSDEEKLSFYTKKVWDELAEPILEYESLKEDIEKSEMSNTKKKVAMKELSERKEKAEDEFRVLPSWEKQRTDEEKCEYIKKVAKTIHTDHS